MSAENTNTKTGRWPIVLLAAGGIAVFLASIMLFTVRVTECAVLLRWEKPVRGFVGTRDAGLHLKWPWPVETVQKFDARTHVFVTKPEETYTRDGYTVVVNMAAGWKIADPVLFREKVGSEKHAEELLNGLVRTYKSAILGRHPLFHLVSTDTSVLKFDEIEKEIHSHVAKDAKERYGVEVEFTRIKQIVLPKEVVKAVLKRMREERERIAVDIRQKGEEEARKIKADADAAKERILADARAQAKKLRGQADADAAKFYEVFARDEELAVFLRKLEALRNTLKERSTVILTTKQKPYDLLEKGWKNEKVRK